MAESPHSRLFVRTAPAPPSPTHNDTSPHEPHVLSRLSALLSPISHTDSGPGSHDPSALGRSKTAPPHAWAGLDNEDAPISPTTFVDRDAIKVLVVTWNMGESLPKGDLSVLFGEVPPYVPDTNQDPDDVPKLPVENKHPYHLVVVAGQECPTLSGVPRGLGGGLMKGVSVRLGHRKDKDDKDKDKKAADKDKDKDKDKEEVKDSKDQKEQLAPVDEDSDSDDEDASSSSPLPPASGQNKQGKGWSAMLDDWFCGPAKENPARSSSPAGFHTPASSIPSTPINTTLHNPLLAAPAPPNLVRASTSPGNVSPNTSPRIRTVSPLNHTYLPKSGSSPASDSSEEDSEYMSVPVPRRPTSPGHLRPKSSLPGLRSGSGASASKDQDAPNQMAGRDGCYVHLVKERLMGIFFSIYVYKGCEHLVEGVDKDFVTAGLAGGRVGNKGGIGISVKLAGHRFLFVNSHLAAHASRVDARVANIAKINSELDVDCFLPKDDPRAALPDLTDRFDTVFWCGDLNFRLNVSRLHAEWLVEQKKYSEMLMWDQLRALMKDPDKNPFPGFEEHEIDFAPTFKYDVWRSIKATNRELKRSLRRRQTLEGHSRRPSLADIHTAGLSGVPETDVDSEDARQDAETGTIASRRSMESTSYACSTAGSITGTDADDLEDFSNSVDASAYGSRHRALEAAFKEKTKHLFGKIDKVLSSTSSSTKSLLGRHTGRQQEKKHSHDSAPDSRRISISSSMSYEPRTPIMDMPDRLPFGSPRSGKYSFGGQSYNGPRRPSVDSTAFVATSPNQSLVTRKPSALRRTFSGMSARGEEVRSDHSHENGIMEIDERLDYREGVYDSSKKQRVPSWCDRVLWKTHVVPDPVDLNDDQQDEPTPAASARAMSRISNAFSHLRMSITRTTSQEAHEKSNFHVSTGVPPSLTPPIGSSRSTSVASPAHSPSLPSSGAQTPRSGAQTPRSGSPVPKHRSGLVTPVRTSSLPPRRKSDDPRPRLAIRTNSGGLAHPLMGMASATLSPIAKPKVTYEPAVAADEDRSPVNNLRPRANSETTKLSGVTPTRSRSLSTHVEGIITPPRKPDPGSRRTSTGSLKGRLQTSSSSGGLTKPPMEERRSSGTLGLTAMARNASLDGSGFARFIKDLPNWLHGKSHAHDVHDHRGEHHEDDSRPRRHREGEVVCLHYGTIDDLGMRQLEGRSDHRPAIFAAAVYI